jgi:hypothetical protein
LNLNSAVRIVARASEVLEIRGFVGFFFESSSHLYGEKKTTGNALDSVLMTLAADSNCGI